MKNNNFRTTRTAANFKEPNVHTLTLITIDLLVHELSLKTKQSGTRF